VIHGGGVTGFSRAEEPRQGACKVGHRVEAIGSYRLKKSRGESTADKMWGWLTVCLGVRVTDAHSVL